MPYEPPEQVYRPPATPRRRRTTRSVPRPARAARPPRLADVYRRRRRALGLLYVVLSLELIAAALTSPVLGVKRVQVEGVAGLPADEVSATLRAAALPPDTNWLRAPIAQMETKLRALPWARQAFVSRRFPNGLNVEIAPRRPVVLTQTGDGIFEVDADGVPIRRARPALAGSLQAAPPASLLARMNAFLNADAYPQPFVPALPFMEMLTTQAAIGSDARLPVVVLERPRPVQAGVPLHDDALTTAIQIVRDQRANNVVRIAKIEVDQSDNICLNMQDGIPVYWGQSEDFAAKLDLVRGIYAQEPNIARRVSAINLTCPSSPACTPRNVAPTATLPPRAQP